MRNSSDSFMLIPLKLSEDNVDTCGLDIILRLFVLLVCKEARWPSGRASDFGSRGRGSILTRVAVLYP